MCLAQGQNFAVMPVRLEPAAPRSQVKHSTTEPLRSLSNADKTPLNAHTDKSSVAWGVNGGWSIHLHLNLVYTGSKGLVRLCICSLA